MIIHHCVYIRLANLLEILLWHKLFDIDHFVEVDSIYDLATNHHVQYLKIK